MAPRNASRSAAARETSERLRPMLERLTADGLGVRLIAQALARETGRPMDPGTVRQHLARLGLRTAAQEAGTYGGSSHGARVRAGLQRAQARGVPIGNSPGAIAARQARTAAAAAFAGSVRERLEDLAADGLSRRGMALALAADGITDHRGRPVGVSAIRAALQRLGIRTARSRAMADATPPGHRQARSGEPL